MSSGNLVVDGNLTYLVEKVAKEKYALIADYTALATIVDQRDDLSILTVRFVTEAYSVALQKGSAYAADIDKA